jgi:hypothetical protein
MDQGEYEGGFVLTAEARRAQSFLKHNGHEDHSEGSTFLSFRLSLVIVARAGVYFL